MARTITAATSTEAGTKTTTTQRKCVEIYIDVDPRRPKSMRLYFADVTTEVFAPSGGGPEVVRVVDVQPVGMLPVPQDEMLAMPIFPTTYAALSALADQKSTAEWPELPSP